MSSEIRKLSDGEVELVDSNVFRGTTSHNSCRGYAPGGYYHQDCNTTNNDGIAAAIHCPRACMGHNHFSVNGSHFGQCNLTCHMNPLEHLLAFPAIAGIDGSDPSGAVELIRSSLIAPSGATLGTFSQGHLWTLGLAIPNAYDLANGWGTCAGIVAGGQYPCSQYFQDACYF
eukprot:COSAG01_NODE_6812_length_3486_cov_32.265427_2_plen_172_part_00